MSVWTKAKNLAGKFALCAALGMSAFHTTTFKIGEQVARDHGTTFGLPPQLASLTADTLKLAHDEYQALRARLPQINGRPDPYDVMMPKAQKIYDTVKPYIAYIKGEADKYAASQAKAKDATSYTAPKTKTPLLSLPA